MGRPRLFGLRALIHSLPCQAGFDLASGRFDPIIILGHSHLPSELLQLLIS
jgi:hypothetical protein